MARFTIELPDELGASTNGPEHSPAAVAEHQYAERARAPTDPATRRFVSWVETWAGA